ncbi:MAG: hypothetical protein K8953_09750 [Proteobacteria bacterium]|nr:hypothetical protein [Pseudomonadota bacterium]
MGKPTELEKINCHICDLLKEYKKLEEIDQSKDSLHWFFNSFLDFAPNLMNNKHALSMLLIYLYMRLEHAQRRILYGAAIAEYGANKDITEYITEKFRMSRKGFYKSYRIMAGEEFKISTQIKSIIHPNANSVRDNIMHGKYTNLDEDKKQNAIISVFEYSKELNEKVKGKFEFMPFGRLEELEGRDGQISEDVTIDKLKDAGISL